MRGRQRASGFTLIEMTIVVAIIGILAAIAIPAFSKYVRRSKTTEAVMNLRKLFDSSVAYYERDYSDRAGESIPSQFPGVGLNFGPAPGGHNPCCGGDEGPKCLPDPEAWSQPIWQALNFSVDDPHYYWYHYISEGTGIESRFTARSMGNLNCNDTYSTFERVGGVSSDGDVVGSAGIYSINPLE